MNLESINNYLNMIEHIYNISLKTRDQELKELCLDSLMKFINDLYNNQIIDEKSYQDLLNKYYINNNFLVKDLLNKIDDEEEKNSNDKLSHYENELKSIFNNPNKESIKVWLLNFVSYANSENMEYDVMIKFINEKFNMFDKDKKFSRYVDDFLMNGKDSEYEEIQNDIKDEVNVELVNVKTKFLSDIDKKNLKYKSLVGISNILDDSLYSSLLDKIVNEQNKDLLSKDRYNLIRKNMFTENTGSFDNVYKKNRLASILLNNRIKDLDYKEQKYDSLDDSSILVKDIHKGMKVI